MVSARAGLGLGQCSSSRSTCVDLQALEAALDRALQVAVGEVVDPDLGGQEDLVARHAGGRQGRADVLLVAIGLGGVDVAVAQLQRPFDQRLGGAVVQLPSAQADGGDQDIARTDGGNELGHR
jgi:hypothetical protein